MEPIDERDLVRRCVEGDRKAWEAFVRRFSPVVYAAIHHAFRRWARPHDPDEIADLHDAIFLDFYENDCHKLQQHAGRCSLASWVRVVAVNRTIDFLRRRQRRESVQVEGDSSGPGDGDAGPSLFERMAGSGPDTETVVDARRRVELLRRAIEALRPADRRLLEMLFEQDLSFAEIADELGTSIGAVYVRKNRLLRRLRAKMAELARSAGGAEVPPRKNEAVPSSTMAAEPAKTRTQ